MISFLQEAQGEPNALVRRLNKIIESSENRKKFRDSLITYQEKMKSIFDKKSKRSSLSSRRFGTEMGHRMRRKGEHGKFDPLWYGPYRISEARSNNTFILEDLDGESVQLPVNG